VRAGPRGVRGCARHRPVRVDAVDQRRRRGGGGDARLGPPARLHPGPSRLTPRRTGGGRGAAPRRRRLRGSPRAGGRARIGCTHAQGRPTGASVDRVRGVFMPIATPEVYADMLDRAKAGSFAYPAINVSSSQTLNAALKGFADAGSDGIIQVSTGGADYLSGPSVKNMVTGSAAFAAYAAEVAKNYPVNIALHTDHCPKDKLDGFVRPLLDISIER